MTFVSLEQEACSLPADQRRRLIARLVAIQKSEDDPHRLKKLAQKIDDTNTARWLTPEAAERELGLTSENG
jgi:hypothetical protein